MLDETEARLYAIEEARLYAIEESPIGGRAAPSDNQFDLFV